MKIPRELTNILISIQDTLGGSVRFDGTRLPVELFLDTLNSGYSLEAFLQTYPTIRREQAEAVLNWQNSLSKESIGLMTAR